MPEEKKRTRGISAFWGKFRNFFDGAFRFFILRIYSPILSLALSFRYAMMAIAVATVLVTLGFVGSGRVTCSGD